MKNVSKVKRSKYSASPIKSYNLLRTGAHPAWLLQGLPERVFILGCLAEVSSPGDSPKRPTNLTSGEVEDAMYRRQLSEVPGRHELASKFCGLTCSLESAKVSLENLTMNYGVLRVLYVKASTLRIA